MSACAIVHLSFTSYSLLIKYYSIVAVAVPLSRRSVVYGFSGAVYGVSSVIAPLLGGAFTTKLTWRWCFFINIPCGGLTFLVVLLFFRMPPKDSSQSKSILRSMSKITSLDFIGMFLFMPSTVCLLLALQWGGTTFSWNNGRIIALWVVFGVLFLAFLLAEWRRPSKAMLPFRLLKNSTIISCAAYNFCMGGSASVMEYYVSAAAIPNLSRYSSLSNRSQIPIYFQAVKGLSALDSGLRTIPMILGFVVFGILGGLGTSYIGYCRLFMVAGGALMAIGAGLMTMLTPESSPALYLGLQVIIGAGGGLGGQQAFTAIGTAIHDDDIPLASSVIIFSQMVGSTVFVTAAQNIFTGLLTRELRAANVNSSPISSVGVTHVQAETPPDELPMVLKFYNEAATKVFFIAVALGCLATIAAFGVRWQSVRSKGTPKDENHKGERYDMSEAVMVP
jgi:MFS family permease